MPDINRSEATFSIDNGAIRFGLTNIRYLAQQAASVIIKNRPYASYEQFYAFASAKGSGLSTRIIGALNRVNGAVFPDNPAIDISENMFEYLGIPVFDDKWMVPGTRDRLTRAADYNEGDGAIIYGMVNDISSKPGATWNRVTVLDNSGDATFFTGPDPGVEKGKMYLFLMGNKRILDYVPVEEIADTDKVFVRYLKAKRVSLDEGQYLVVEFNKRQTKKGAWMANTICVNHELKLESIIVFPRQFGSGIMHMKPGSLVMIEKGYMDDGTVIVNKVRSI
jgi:DNA polymerase III subunit alpha